MTQSPCRVKPTNPLITTFGILPPNETLAKESVTILSLQRHLAALVFFGEAFV
ncbi:MAG: hypothetical protein PHT20_12280 [Rhodoferax sp.]|nr:hypothetical protein [Rhodoferax sp.]